MAEGCRVSAVAAANDFHVQFVSPGLELLDGGGAERIGGAEED